MTSGTPPSLNRHRVFLGVTFADRAADRVFLDSVVCVLRPDDETSPRIRSSQTIRSEGSVRAHQTWSIGAPIDAESATVINEDVAPWMEACILDRCLASGRCVCLRLGGSPSPIQDLASFRCILFRVLVRFAGRAGGALDRNLPDPQERGQSEGARICRARTGSLSTSSGPMDSCARAESPTVIRFCHAQMASTANSGPR